MNHNDTIKNHYTHWLTKQESFPKFPLHSIYFVVIIVDHLPQSHPTLSILFYMSSFTATMNLVFSSRLQHLLSSVSTIPPLPMSKPSQPSLSNFVSKLLNLSCSSDILTSIPDPPGPSYYLQLCHLLLLLKLLYCLCLRLQTRHRSRSHYHYWNFPFRHCCHLFTLDTRLWGMRHLFLSTPLPYLSCLLSLALLWLNL